MIFTEVQISKNNVETVISTEALILPRFHLCPALGWLRVSPMISCLLEFFILRFYVFMFSFLCVFVF